jgi:hypothetical protein
LLRAGTYGQIYVSYLKEEGVNLVGLIDDAFYFQGKKLLGLVILLTTDRNGI